MESLKAEATVRAREANFQLLQELLERALSRRGGGMATGLDTARLEAQLENERHNLSVVRYEVDRLQVNLIHAMGIPFDVRVILTDQLQTDIPHVPTIPEAVSTAIANRAEIKAQTQRIRTASLTLKSTESERIPSLVGQGDYGLIGNRVHNTLDTYNVAALLSIPIFDGGQREGRISESRSQVRQETIRMQVVANQVVLEVREALITLASAREQFGIAQSGLKAALTELVLARERFSVLTSGNNLELTNATFSLARARENAVDAMFRLNASRVNLARGTGQLEKLQ